jgi:homoserine acetyltransferase
MAWGYALMGGMGLLNMFSANEEAAQQAAAQQWQEQAQHAVNTSNYYREIMTGSLQNMMKNIEISRVNQARLRQNRAIALAAIQTRALQEGQQRRQTASSLYNISIGSHQALDKLLTSASGAGISTQSGTYKALQRALLSKGKETMQSLKANDYLTRQNIIRQHDNALGQRDLYGWTQGSYYLPGPAPQLLQTPQHGRSFLQNLTSFMGGAGQGAQFMGNLNQALTGGGGDGIDWFGWPSGGGGAVPVGSPGVGSFGSPVSVGPTGSVGGGNLSDSQLSPGALAERQALRGFD